MFSLCKCVLYLLNSLLGILELGIIVVNEIYYYYLNLKLIIASVK